MNVSIVIPTYKRGDTALKLGIQCKKHEPNAEIIIVDASPNIQPRILQSAKKNDIVYLIIREKETANAKNIGWQKAKGEIIVFFDDDVEINHNTIREHVLAYNNNSNIVGIAGRVINTKDSIPTDTHIETGKMNMLGTRFSMNFWSTKKQRVDFPYGCNMSFRKSVLKKIGSFSNTYGFEEIDLGLRAKKYRAIIFNPKSVVKHLQLSSGGTRSDLINYRKEYWKNWGRLIRAHVPFPLSLISLVILTYRAFKKNMSYVLSLYGGYFTK